ncbi:MAG: zinc-ribbon domain-containing protein [Promethearchaeota archaeon]
MGKIAYCNNCNRVVEKPRRKPIDSFRLNIYIIIIIATLGFGLIPFLIYRLAFVKKNYCPDCQSKLRFYASRSELPGDTTPFLHLIERVEAEKKKGKFKKETKKEEVLRKVEEKKKKKVQAQEFKYCPFCNKKLEKDATVCSYCGTQLDEN